MISVYSVLYTLVLFSELSSHSVSVAMPASKVEDGVPEQDGFFLGGETMTDLVLDNDMRDEDGSPKIIIVSDMGLKGHSIRGLNRAASWSLPLLTDRSLSYTPAEHSLKIERRNTDIDMLRCMIGRVYRPCWQV
ncbi:pro-MCH [Anarrhichthys ocellatus]|uniref:pro-MCH n=1 Tax=Anarrhichthys ocellatus TaxID=433405 RepID=UPI0012EDB44B|nr:pro-MCH [Anarrhichthys ocellatus]